MIIILMLVNFVVGNNIVGIGLWIPLGLIFGMINKNLLAKGLPSWSLRFSDKPLKEKLAANLGNYITSRN
jgi:hypothetical protein